MSALAASGSDSFIADDDYPIAARCMVQLPASPHDKPLVYIALDALAKASDDGKFESQPARPEDVFWFADSLLELAPQLAAAVLPSLLQTSFFERIGPTLHLVPVPHDAAAAFDLSGWSRILGTIGPPRLAGILHVPPGADLHEPAERHALA